MSERCNYISTEDQIDDACSLIKLLKGPAGNYETGSVAMI
jgi:hypothetical protein